MNIEKENQIIMTVKRNLLFGDDCFQGLKRADEIDFQKRILDNFEYIRRGDAEKNPAYKQPIGYAVLLDSETGKIFAYKRASKEKDYSEKRLYGNWSWGLGGHIDKPDQEGDDPIKKSIERELEEEIEIDGKILDVAPIGYINDDSNSVGEVHFGVLYLTKFIGSISPKDTEIEKGEMKSLDELLEMSKNHEYQVEEWSKIALEFIKKFN